MSRAFSFIADSGGTSLGSAAVFYPADARLTTGSSRAQRQLPIYEDGVVSALQYHSSSNAKTVPILVEIRNGGTATAVALTIPASTSGWFQDLSNSESISSGDLITIEQSFPSGTGTGTNTANGVSFAFSPDDGGINKRYDYMIVTSFSAASTSSYFCLAGDSAGGTLGNETNARFEFRTATTLRNLYCYIGTNGRSTDSFARLRKNGADGNQTITIPASTTGAFEDNSNSDSMSVGDEACYVQVTGTGTGTYTPQSYSVEAYSTTRQYHFIGGRSITSASFAAVTTRYFPIAGNTENGDATESNGEYKVVDSMTISDLYLRVGSNTMSASSTLTFRKNGAGTALTLTVGAGSTGEFKDSSNSVRVDQNDLINHEMVNSSGTGALSHRLFGIMATTFDDVTDSRSAEVHGVDTANAARAAEVTGADSSNSARSAEIDGQDTATSSRSAEMHGIDSATASRGAEIEGSVSSTDERDAEINGQDSANDSRGSEVHGFLTENNERDAEVTGAERDTSMRSSEVHGQESSEDLRQVEVTGADSASSNRGSEVTGEVRDNDSRVAEIWGSDTDNANRLAEIEGSDVSDSERDAEIHGVEFDDDERDAEITGYDQLAASRPAEVSGGDSANDNRASEVHGVDTAQDTRSAETHGADTSTANRSAELTGSVSVTDERDTEVHGQATDASVRPAETHGQLATQESRSAHVHGSVTETDERDAEVSGIESLSNSRSAEIDGGDPTDVSSSRGAEIEGGHPYPYCPEDSPYTPKASPLTAKASPYSAKTKPYSDIPSPFTPFPHQPCH